MTWGSAGARVVPRTLGARRRGKEPGANPGLSRNCDRVANPRVRPRRPAGRPRGSGDLKSGDFPLSATFTRAGARTPEGRNDTCASCCCPPPTPNCWPPAPAPPTRAGQPGPGRRRRPLPALLRRRRPRRRAAARRAAGLAGGLAALLRRRACRWSRSAARPPDAELMALSTVPAGRGHRGARLPARGRPGEPRRSWPASCPTPCCSPARASTPPTPLPAYGLHGRAPTPTRRTGPTVGVVFYRAHELSGNTAFVDALCDALEARGCATRCRSSARSLRGSAGRRAARAARPRRRADRHRARGRRRAAADAIRGRRRGAGTPARWPRWTCRCCRALCLTSSRAQWAAPTPRCPRWTPRCRSRSRSSTAG